MERIEKTWIELDFSRVDFSEGSGWSWSRGGAPLRDEEYAISFTEFYEKDPWFQETRYKLPDCLSKMLRLQWHRGREEAKADIRSALGVTR